MSRGRSIVGILAPLVVWSSLATGGGAGPFTVDSTADEPDADTGNPACATLANQCTLRAAIQQANARPGPDEIVLPAGTYTLVVEGEEDEALAGDLDVTEDVTITGAGAGATVVDANGIDRVFDLLASATISGMTIRGGAQTNGGGLLVFPVGSPITLSLAEVHVTHNEAVRGGGIYVEDATLVVERSTLSVNTASGEGGAIENVAGVVTLQNVTVSGNISTRGDGIVNTGTLTLDHVTLHDDDVDESVDPGAGTTILRATLLAAGARPACAGGTFVSQGYNLEHGTSCGLTATGDQPDVDPQLGALQDNGAGTPTHAVPATSPVIDAVVPCPPPSTDQRGVTRPIDGDGDATAACDVGAFELDPGPVTTTTTSTTSTTASTTTSTLPCATDATFAGILCGTEALSAAVDEAALAGKLRDGLIATLGKVRSTVELAESAGASNPRRAKKPLARAAKLVKKVGKKIGGRKGVAAIPDAAARAALQSDVDALRAAILALRGLL